MTDQILSLPRGGGALRGIGETFAPDLQTGTGNLTVPLPVLPGRAGLTPQLALAYSTGAGNGPYGLGWSLSVPGVSRKTSHGLPRYDDGRDTFLLSGAEDLVPVGGGRYRPRTEGLFARIEHVTGAGGDFWRVRTRDGRTSTYGTPRPPAAPPGWRDPAVTADPADPARVFAWHLTSTVDTFGNRVTYGHVRDGAQVYLSRVSYVDDGDRFLAEVRFEHEERPDAFSDRRPGFEVRTRLRCRRIALHSPAAGDGPVRTTTLRYDDSAANGLSLLVEVLVEGHDGGHTEALAPLRFGWTGFEPEGRHLVPVTGELPVRSLADPALALVDLTGDGLPDVLDSSTGLRWWRNLGGGRFDRPRTMAAAPAARLGSPGVHLLDADGDGRLDLVTGDGYHSLNPDGEWDATRTRWEVAPGFPDGDPSLRFVDLDGDGVTDALRTGSRFECFFNDPRTGWGETRVVERGSYPEFPDVDLADPRVQLADMTGDGLADIVLVHDGQVEFWPSLGRGSFGPRQVMRDSPRFPEGYDPRRVLLGDVVGDGAADLVLVDDDSVTLWVNRCGQGFAPPVTVKGTPRPDPAAVRLVDLLGTGVAGILWTSDTAPPWFLDLTGGVKPGLLSTVDSGTGAVTRVTYASSTAFPGGRGVLPFPVRVVAGVEVTDAIGGGRLTTAYSYADGHWDGAEREFRGFGRVDQRDTVDTATGALAPLLTRTWFALGPVGPAEGAWVEPDPAADFWPGDRPLLTRPPELTALLDGLPRRERRDAVRALRGQRLRTEVHELDGTERAGRPVTVTESVPSLRREHAGVWFPHVVASRTTHWDRGDDPMTSLELTGDHDPYGHPRRQVSIAVPRGRDPRAASGPPCLVTRTTTVTASRDDAAVFLTGLPARTVTEELLDDGRSPVPALRPDLPARVVAETRTYFDGEPFEGLPPGRVGDHGVPSRSETLVLTDELLAAAYGTVPPPLSGAWTTDYPAEFRTLLPAGAGYARHDGGWWSVTGRKVDARGLTVATLDPAGAVSTVDHDARGLPIAVTDPAGLVTTAVHDDRTFAVAEVTDPNGTRTAVRYTPLGLVERTTVLGSLDVPDVRHVHDLRGWVERRQPVSVRTIRRVHHAGAAGVPADDLDETVESVEFSDGFGRLLQTRTQAEDVVFGDPVTGASDVDAPGDLAGTERRDRVVVGGWRTYDAKGRVIEAYEPFFGTGFGYAPPGEAELGRKATTGYDARGRVVRVTGPDGSQHRTVHGVPADLADPDRFAPTPWETYAYDANDNAGRTHPAGSAGYRSHWDTPASTVVDPLGRTVLAVSRLGTEEHTVRSAYDVRGNLLAVTDELGRVAYRHAYDLAGHVLRTEQLDAGVTFAVVDATGATIETRDARGALVLQGHDAARRPSRVWARDAAGEPVTLRQRLAYGTDPAARTAGRLVRHHDEAGVLGIERYDVDGNPVESVRRVVSDAAVLAGWTRDWSTVDQPVLDPGEYRTSSEFDALGRARSVRLPADVTGHRALVVPRYDRSGGLRSVRLDDVTYVEHLAHDALGRRTLVVLGNGVLTRYGYDPDSFRLRRLRTQRFTRVGPLAYRPGGAPVQDLTYAHDLVGNLLSVLDRTPGSGVPGRPDELLRRFDHDPRYRLVAATGREHDLPRPAPWEDVPVTDPVRARAYTEAYTYDPAGNLLELRHSARGTRAYAVAGNRLASMTVERTRFDYAHDPAGNVVREGTSRHLSWDAAGRLRSFRVQAAAVPSLEAHYLYDAAGARVRKVVRTQDGAVRSTVYIGGTVEHFRFTAGAVTRRSTTLHVLDGTRRIALVRVGDPEPGDASPPVTYELADHLGSAVVTLDAAGAPVGVEEFTPYGETSFGGRARKRYRFTGKERDEESGLSYHGARHYAPWLARWTTPDPAGPVDGPNLYRYARNNPLTLTDPTGTQSQPPSETQATGTTPSTAGRPAGPDAAPAGTTAREQAAGASLAEEHAPVTTASANGLDGINDHEWASAVRSWAEIPESALRITDSTLDVAPTTLGLAPSNPKATLRPAEHALEIQAKTGKGSPYISASMRSGGASGFAGDARVWIDIRRATQRGAEFVSEQALAADMTDLVKAQPELADRAQAWRSAQPREREVLFKGVIDARAVDSAAMRYLRYGGRTLQVAGAGLAVYDMGRATAESVRLGSAKPAAAEALRQGGSWAMAWAGAKLGAAAGAAAGIETGPGAVLTGLGGALVLGTAGYFGFDLAADLIHRN